MSPPPVYPLTERQEALFRFIERFQHSESRSPSLCEMAAGIGLHSKAGILRLLRGLVARGRARTWLAKGRYQIALFPAPASRAPDGAPLYFIPAPERRP